ncbi:phage holin family protein [Demequina phytophila]|uniref:phage holin family protein n=1 Tax=Demequina phytophila TaxID=1638981 RepID=UPI0014704F28|nr:phage holin family protein [Demequina phytophila]
MRFVLISGISAVAVWLVTLLPLGVEVQGGDGGTWARIGVFLLVGAVMAATNMLIKPVVDLLSLPIKILTLGLFALVTAWFMLWLTAWLTTLVPWAELTIGDFWETLFAALLISIITAILTSVVPGAAKR